eukprot:1137697-Pyramimonas_sp.AAC.1
MFEAAQTAQAPVLSAVLSDWLNAFDRVKHGALLGALRRFGRPADMLDMAAAILQAREIHSKGP